MKTRKKERKRTPPPPPPPKKKMAPPPGPLRRRPSAALALLLLLQLLSTVPSPALAMFEDDAGKADFAVRTAGHSGSGPYRGAWLSPDGLSVLTSDGGEALPDEEDGEVDGFGFGLGLGLGLGLGGYVLGPHVARTARPGSGCSLASRSLADGSLNWRRSVCTGEATVASARLDGAVVRTVDSGGVEREWDAADGSLLSDGGGGRAGAVPARGRRGGGRQRERERREPFGGHAACGSLRIEFGTAPDQPALSSPGRTVRMEGGGRGTYPALLSPVDGAAVLRCQGTEEGGTGTGTGTASVPSMTVLLQTKGRTTALLQVSATGPGDGADAVVDVRWTAEEALASVTDAIFLDRAPGGGGGAAVEAGADGDGDGEGDLLRSLSLTSRLSAQLGSLARFVSGGFASDVRSIFLSASGLDEAAAAGLEARERRFGFAKVGVLLSSSAGVVLGMDLSTAVPSRAGAVAWRAALPPQAAWSRLVRGGTSARTLVGGGQDRHSSAHSHGDVLVVSYVPPGAAGGNVAAAAAALSWRCLDGLTGRTHAEGTVSAPSEVAQILPLYAAPAPDRPSPCRQAAAVVHSDGSLTVLPETGAARAAVADAVGGGAARGGLFAHTIDREGGNFRSYRLAAKPAGGGSGGGGDVAFSAQEVGASTFDPALERIVSVAYPRRNEVVQSPSVTLGDDSLLLRYLNPHLCVVVTSATDESLARAAEVEGIARALAGGTAREAKPLGATKPGEEAPAAATAAAIATPNLFVNLVDTVSGQVLYRASHLSAASSDVPVLVSENWVIYAFTNSKTRRTEVGVLSLHEGMIDKKGITAFTAPEQELTFSSFASSKPIVLSRTYTMTSAVTALGVSTTQEGISMKQILMATGEGGQLVSVDRRMLDPRRPTGEVKESEKKEGLHTYHPLIPVSTLRIPSYSQRIESVTSIASTAANVESQSLVLAYGGPDLFFTRMSPSRGFDLLPEGFNRALLSVVVGGLCLLVASVKKMSTKKMIATNWA